MSRMVPEATPMDATAPTIRRYAPVAAIALATLLVGFLTGLGVSRRAIAPLPASPAGEGPPFSLPVAVPGLARAAALDTSFTEVARRIMPAVVNISSTRVIRARGGESPSDPFFHRFFGEDFFRQFEVPRERREQSLGSGVIVTSDGYVITNNHVVAGAEEVRVTLADRREFDARIVGADPKTDVAVLKLDAKGLPNLPLGDSDETEVGQVVLAVGNPFGLGQTVTMGIISAKGRANMGIVDYEDFIQTDAAINPGNSGGALVNARGELIGINTAIATRTGGYQGVGFAIPSNMARDVSQDLIRHGKVTRGYLGVVIQPVTPALAEAFKLREARGALVGDVSQGSPAARGGLKRGDVIVKFDGQEVDDYAQFRLRVARTEVGRKVNLEILRDGRRLPLQVTVGEMPSAEGEGGQERAVASGTLEGITVEDLTPALIRRLGVPRQTRGVVVGDVGGGSAAAEAGIRPGQVILEVNRRPTASVAAFRAAARAVGKGTAVLLVQQGESSAYVTVR
jgi:serine protease Do